MSSRTTRETGGGVLSFTFLDVLTCTMGSLVLLVVILGQKAANTSLEDALRNPKKGPSTQSAGTATAGASAPSSESTPSVSTSADPTPEYDADEAFEVAKLQAQEAELEKLREEAKRRLAEEQARLAHLEEHERRLEHELAKLHSSLELLAASEQKQTVDQVTAERELKRLTELIADTEKQIKSLTMAGGKKSYAIVPYKGKYGTFRRPIYIECTKGGVVIQPEGIKLQLGYDPESERMGHPLPAAIRAAREELNARAVAAGEKEMPNAYPLFIVRPDGVESYVMARAALEAWDSDYGEEYVEADRSLQYREADAQLEQIMLHAIDQAINRQAMLAKIAPRQYGGASASAPSKVVRLDDNGGMMMGPQDATSSQDQSNWLANPQDSSGRSSGGGRRRYGESAGLGGAGPSGGDFIDEFIPPEASQIAASGNSKGGAEEGVPGGVPGGPAPTGVTTPSNSATSLSPANMLAAGGAPASVTAPGNESSTSIRAESRAARSAARSRGTNWANAAASRGAPITRPINVVVGSEQLIISPTADASPAPSAERTIISFRQPQDAVLSELAKALQRHIADWGYAGNGMYWRPTLSFQVAPEAVRQAERLNELLIDSGVDVRLNHVASLPDVEPAHARK